jgi:hypothetical protein
VGPEESRQGAPVGVGELLSPLRLGQDDLYHPGVQVDDRGLDQVQRKGGDLDVFAVVAGQIAGLAVEDVLRPVQRRLERDGVGPDRTLPAAGHLRVDHDDAVRQGELVRCRCRQATEVEQVLALPVFARSHPRANRHFSNTPADLIKSGGHSTGFT